MNMNAKITNWLGNQLPKADVRAIACSILPNHNETFIQDDRGYSKNAPFIGGGSSN